MTEPLLRRKTDRTQAPGQGVRAIDIRFQSPTSRLLATVALLVVVAALGWSDYISGPEIAFAIFYVFPIVLAAWYLGRLPMLVVATASGAAWFIADVLSREKAMLSISSWNGITRFVTFLIVGSLVVLVRTDRDELTKLNARLNDALASESRLARTDSLTGLLNSRGFHELLKERLSAAVGTVALLYVDLDDFKRVNDVHGHSSGDQLLQDAAYLIVESIRATDKAARLGGDEFSVLVDEIEVEGARAMAQRIVDQVATLSGRYPGTSVRASVGVAFVPAGDGNADAAIHAADEAMYRAKQNGKGRVELQGSA